MELDNSETLQDILEKDNLPAHRATPAELATAMKEMECWETENHLKVCRKCRNTIDELGEYHPYEIPQFKGTLEALDKLNIITKEELKSNEK